MDLRDRDATFDAVLTAPAAVIVLAAAKVGGIMANSTHPVDFLNDNLRIQTNVFEAAHAAGVDRLLFLGSSCIYPKLAPQPIPESALLTGPLEPTNDAYAIAKIAGIIAIKSYRQPVRPALDLGHADQPVRAGRQLRPRHLARAACDDPQVPRGEGRPADR